MTDTRETLVSVGLKLLTTQGYAATGLQQIVSEAGVPKGSFYNYFASKEAYCAAILDRYMDVLLANLESPGGMTDPLASVRAFHEGLIRIVGLRPGSLACMLGSFATEVEESATTLRDAMTKGFERWVGAYEALFAEAQARGELRKDIAARRLAEIFWNQWQGALAQMRILRSTDSLKASLEAMLTMFAAPSTAAADPNYVEEDS